jgi:hypothetical protein
MIFGQASEKGLECILNPAYSRIMNIVTSTQNFFKDTSEFLGNFYSTLGAQEFVIVSVALPTYGQDQKESVS